MLYIKNWINVAVKNDLLWLWLSVSYGLDGKLVLEMEAIFQRVLKAEYMLLIDFKTLCFAFVQANFLTDWGLNVFAGVSAVGRVDTCDELKIV